MAENLFSKLQKVSKGTFKMSCKPQAELNIKKYTHHFKKMLKTKDKEKNLKSIWG